MINYSCFTVFFTAFSNFPLLAEITEGEGYEKAVNLVLVATVVLILAISRLFEEICVLKN